MTKYVFFTSCNILLLIITSLLFHQPAEAQSDYYLNFLDKKVETVTVHAEVLDSCNFFGWSNYDCDLKKLNDQYISKLETPKVEAYKKGELVTRTSIKNKGGIIEETKTSYLYGNKHLLSKISELRVVPLREGLEVLFEHGGYSYQPRRDTVHYHYKGDKLMHQANSTGEQDKYVYDKSTNQLMHILEFAVPHDFKFTDDLINESLDRSQEYLPKWLGDSLLPVEQIAMGGLLCEIEQEQQTINLFGREDYVYNKHGLLIKKITLEPPFSETTLYTYDNNQRVKKEIVIHHGETGIAEMDTTTFQYDKKGLPWDSRYKLIYDQDNLVEVQFNTTEIVHYSEPEVDVNGELVEDQNGEIVYIEGTYKETNDQILFKFEYDKKGRIEKEIVPGKVTYRFSYD